MNKKKRTIPIISTLIISFIFIFSLANAQKAEVTKSTQVTPKKVTSEKKSVQKIRPGDVYPGDAAVAGYEETSVFAGPRVRSYQVKDKERTYIFSEVEGYLPGRPHGYFRVLEYHGYGRDQEDKRDHLIFAAQTPVPGCRDPVKPECGMPLRKVGGIIFLFFTDFGDFFAVYHPIANYGSGALTYLNADVPEQDITDIDGDGNLEIKAFISLKDTPKGLSIPITRVMAIYKYIEHDKNCGCSRFIRVKGRAYEKTYMEHASKMKEEKKIVAWLAAVECTENPELIRIALDEFMNLPSPDQKEKQSILEMLIRNGFVGLKIDHKNP